MYKLPGRGSGIEGKSNEGDDRREISVREQDKKFRDAANLNTFLSLHCLSFTPPSTFGFSQ